MISQPVGHLLDVVALQCQRRGLHSTSIWLGELALSGTERTLNEKPTNIPFSEKHTGQIDDSLEEESKVLEYWIEHEIMQTDLLFHLNDLDTLHTSLSKQVTALLESLFSIAETHNKSDNSKNNISSEKVEMYTLQVTLQKWIVCLRRWHCVALGYFNRKEYQRCYALLDKSLQIYSTECEKILHSITLPNENLTHASHGINSDSESREVHLSQKKTKEEEEESSCHVCNNENKSTTNRENTERLQHGLSAEKQYNRKNREGQQKIDETENVHEEQQQKLEIMENKIAKLRKVLFTFANPLEFLRFYALFMEGEKLKTLSNNPQRSINPHLRSLRLRLLSLFKTRSTYYDESETTEMRKEQQEEEKEMEEPSEEEPPTTEIAGSDKSNGHEVKAENKKLISNDDEVESNAKSTTHTTRRSRKEKKNKEQEELNCECVQGKQIGKLSTLQNVNAQTKLISTGKVEHYMTSNTENKSSSSLVNKSEKKVEKGASSQTSVHHNNTEKEEKHVEEGELSDDEIAQRYTSCDGVDVSQLRSLHLIKQDVYLCWLMGVILKESNMKQEAASFFIAAIMHNPLLWCSWEELSTLINTESQLEELEQLVFAQIQPSFMTELFITFTRAALGLSPIWPHSQLYENNKKETNANLISTSSSTLIAQRQEKSPASAHVLLSSLTFPVTPNTTLENGWEQLLELFPGNTFLLSKLAEYYYVQRKELPKARHLYELVIRNDPYKLDILTDYSNLLFIQGDVLSLSGLAQRVYLHDPFSAEVNFVVGNYYVVVGEHERSVLHFKRATVINPQLTPAWTLLGHAYVEVKNSAAAIEAYKVALSLNPRDYRGWYNLGQIYELLQAYPQALEYYWHTTILRPRDPRMWSAVGNCLSKAGRVAESMSCFEKAEFAEPIHASTYPPLVKKLAIYYLQNKRSVAKGCLYLSKLLQSKATTREDKIFALPYLIQYHVDEAAQLIAAPHHRLPATSTNVNKNIYESHNNNNKSNTEKSVKGEVAQMTWKRQGAKYSVKRTKNAKNEKVSITNATGAKNKSNKGENDNYNNTSDATSVVWNWAAINDQAHRHLTIAEQQMNLLECFTNKSTTTSSKSSLTSRDDITGDNTYKRFITRTRRKIIVIRD